MNRALCHLKLKNIPECIDDCTTALRRLDGDPTPLEKKLSIVKLLSRRGAAYSLESKFDKALQDFKSALKMDPNNENLKQDIKNIESNCVY